MLLEYSLFDEICRDCFAQNTYRRNILKIAKISTVALKNLIGFKLRNVQKNVTVYVLENEGKVFNIIFLR